MNYALLFSKNQTFEAVGRLDDENLAILPTLIDALEAGMGCFERPINDFKLSEVSGHVATACLQSTLSLHYGNGARTAITDHSCRTDNPPL